MDSYLFLINFLFFPLSFGSNYGSSKKGLKPKKRGGGIVWQLHKVLECYVVTSKFSLKRVL